MLKFIRKFIAVRVKDNNCDIIYLLLFSVAVHYSWLFDKLTFYGYLRFKIVAEKFTIPIFRLIKVLSHATLTFLLVGTI